MQPLKVPKELAEHQKYYPMDQYQASRQSHTELVQLKAKKNNYPPEVPLSNPESQYWHTLVQIQS